jgi:hypothetical protein
MIKLAGALMTDIKTPQTDPQTGGEAATAMALPSASLDDNKAVAASLPQKAVVATSALCDQAP